MRKKPFIFMLFLTVWSFLPLFSFALDDSAGMGVSLEIIGCNDNGKCEPPLENFLNCPNDCKPDGGKTGGSVTQKEEDVFINLKVVPSCTSAVISWSSSVPTIYNLSWGEDTEFRDGVLKNVHFFNEHSVELINLKSGTTYYFKIEAQTYLAKIISSGNKYFTTLIPPDVTPPGNPVDVTATPLPSRISVEWTNPTDLDFDYVRIVRSTEQYVSNPYLGKLVYEGSGQYFYDLDIKNGNRYFYTLFARDKSGNFSSGSMANALYILEEGGQVKPEKIEKETSFIIPLQPIYYSVTQSTFTENFELDKTIKVNAKEKATVSANFVSSKKSFDIWIELRDRYDRVKGRYFFVDRKGAEGTRDVIIPELVVNGFYNVSVFRQYNGQFELIHRGTFEAEGGEDVFNKEYSYFIPRTYTITILLIFIILILILLIRKIYKKIKKRKQDRKYQKLD
jgi:hypothetical protein